MASHDTAATDTASAPPPSEEKAAGSNPITKEKAAILTVFYHADCPDGIAAAWAIFDTIPSEMQEDLRQLGGIYTDGMSKNSPSSQLAIGPLFCGLGHGEPRPKAEHVAGRNVIYVDITPPRDVLLWVAAQAASVTVLDHHRSAEGAIGAAAAKFPRTFTSVYREDLSGAQISWDWAHPDSSNARPPAINYIGDRDLWEYKLPESRAINKALYVEGHTRGFGPLEDLAWGNLDGFVTHGESYLRYEAQLISQIAGRARQVIVRARLPNESEKREYCALAVNTSSLPSEVGEALMAKAPPEVHFAVTWSYIHDRDEIWASARTTRPDVDLSIIAPNIVGAKNGGGHPKAAGFAIKGDNVSAVLRPPGAPEEKSRVGSAQVCRCANIVAIRGLLRQLNELVGNLAPEDSATSIVRGSGS